MNLKVLILCFSAIFLLSACQNQYVSKPNQPTEAALVATSVDNGLSTELDINYKDAFKNLRQAYGQCIAFTGEDDFVFTDNKLDEQLAMGTLFARTEGGAYLSKTLVESVDTNRTRLTLFLSADYKFAHSRFKQDTKRALGLDSQCNTAKLL